MKRFVFETILYCAIFVFMVGVCFWVISRSESIATPGAGTWTRSEASYWYYVNPRTKLRCGVVYPEVLGSNYAVEILEYPDPLHSDDSEVKEISWATTEERAKAIVVVECQ